jgi:F-type H+-transporting ATPase subunit delta
MRADGEVVNHHQDSLMEEIARVYAQALFDAARQAGKLDVVKEQLDQFADAISESRELQLFFFSPYFSSAEKEEGLRKAIAGAEPELLNFLVLLTDKHRMPVIFRIRSRFDDLWAVENKRLEVTVTSAIELEPDLVERIGAEIEKQTGQTVELRSEVDADVLGGIVLQVGNKVLDASVRNSLDKLRKSVATAT